MTTTCPITACFHCGEPVTDHGRWSVLIDGESRPMCCPGCHAIAETIVASGLHDYYRHRTELPDVTPLDINDQEISARETLLFYDSHALQKQFVSRDEDAAEATFIIEGISCAACAWLIEHRISQLTGVETASMNLSSHRLVIRWQYDAILVSTMIEALLRLGYKATPFSATEQETIRQRENKLAIRRMAISGFGMMQIMMMSLPTYADMDVFDEFFLRMAQLVLAVPIILYSARPFFSAALRDIKTRHLTMDVPVSLAIMLAFTASIWSTFNQGVDVYFSEICMFIFFLLVGRYFEMRARHRMSRAGNNLLTLLPNLALKVEQMGTEQESETLIASTDIQHGDILRVKPGHTIAADGVVIEGISSVDEAALTGEYLPVSKKVGDNVIGGTHNVESPLLMRVTATGAEAQLSTIMRLLDRAQQSKPRAALIADQVASYFVVAVLLVSVAVLSFWWYHENFEHAFFIVLSVLVVTCPCALALATPTALTAATAALREQGLLISKSHVLEVLPQVDRVVFDKTGTLTEGRLNIERVVPIENMSDTDVLSLAAGIEQHSTHPIARAFRGIEPMSVQQPEQVSGQGISALWQDQRVFLGRADYAWQHPIEPPSRSGQWLLMASETAPLAWILLNDKLRSNAANVVKHLQQRGIQVSLLTGDPSDAGPILAEQLQIDDVQFGMTPEQKLHTVAQWQANGETVMMVGDGINDVPVLAAANLSLAVNEASDLAKTNADTLLTSGNLSTLIHALDVGKKTRRVIKQNHAWAIGYNLLALPAASAGLIVPWQAAIGMSLSSVLVVANAMRLLRIRSIKQLER